MTATAPSRTLLLTVLGAGVLAGAGATYLALPLRTASSAPSLATTSAPAAPTNTAGASVRLSADELARAQITVTPVESAALTDSVAIPGLVEPNAYKQTVVTALVAGRITR